MHHANCPALRFSEGECSCAALWEETARLAWAESERLLNLVEGCSARNVKDADENERLRGLVKDVADCSDLLLAALEVARALADAVPTRAHCRPEDDPLTLLGLLVNTDHLGSGKGYDVIKAAQGVMPCVLACASGAEEE